MHLPHLYPTLALLAFLPALAAEEIPNARPGKGMSLIPGDFAEYTNTQTKGDKTVGQITSIMVAVGQKDNHEGVMVINVRDGKPVSKRVVYYDLAKEKVERGELLENGEESLTIKDKTYKCTWEKRRDGETIATFWKSPDLPFEKYAKVQFVAPDGQKRTTELIHFGPDLADKEGNEKFLKRLEEFNSKLKD